MLYLPISIGYTIVAPKAPAIPTTNKLGFSRQQWDSTDRLVQIRMMTVAVLGRTKQKGRLPGLLAHRGVPATLGPKVGQNQ